MLAANEPTNSQVLITSAGKHDSGALEIMANENDYNEDFMYSSTAM